MRFEHAPLAGVVVVHPELRTDERGGFARVFCQEEFAAQDMEVNVTQANVSVNARAGTVRGMHFQRPPHAEAKLVRATRGAVFDVAVDVRRESPTFLQWFGTRLDERDRTMLYVPPGCAHGYQALDDDTEVTYLVSQAYAPDHEGGLRHDDPALGIAWPLPVTSLSPKDAAWPLLGDGAEAQLP
jgi:dTDP-4-dehydrorhamnose 3,5-epimerase